MYPGRPVSSPNGKFLGDCTRAPRGGGTHTGLPATSSGSSSTSSSLLAPEPLVEHAGQLGRPEVSTTVKDARSAARRGFAARGNDAAPSGHAGAAHGDTARTRSGAWLDGSLLGRATVRSCAKSGKRPSSLGFAKCPAVYSGGTSFFTSRTHTGNWAPPYPLPGRPGPTEGLYAYFATDVTLRCCGLRKGAYFSVWALRGWLHSTHTDVGWRGVAAKTFMHPIPGTIKEAAPPRHALPTLTCRVKTPRVMYGPGCAAWRGAAQEGTHHLLHCQPFGN